MERGTFQRLVEKSSTYLDYKPTKATLPATHRDDSEPDTDGQVEFVTHEKRRSRSREQATRGRDTHQDIRSMPKGREAQSRGISAQKRDNRQEKPSHHGENRVAVSLTDHDDRTTTKVGKTMTKRVGIAETGLRDKDPSRERELRNPR